jgi:WD40-like Beta Propeller Repeat
LVVDLAWSPDGRNLGVVVATNDEGGLAAGEWPRLVALRLDPGQPVRADELDTYDDKVRLVGTEGLLPDHYFFEFAFAWSPDGTRIAVPSQGEVAEISADDGHVLARLPSERDFEVGGQGALFDGGYGPLAWLPER